jgi:hypothetical protein
MARGGVVRRGRAGATIGRFRHLSITQQLAE